ncbi:MAG: PEGA domain-containing protein [Deltaproteobacteria bacterium]|nr:PEGA domain-containing protein [Deltaproteobacteria bacterium]
MIRATYRCVSLILIILFAIPSPVTAKAQTKTTVALVAYPSGDAGVDTINQEFVNALGLKLGSDVEVIDPKIIEQVIKTRPDLHYRSLQDEKIYKSLDSARQAFLISNNALQALLVLDDVQKQILLSPNYSKAFSDLMETTLLMKALIYFKSSQTQRAADEVARLLMLKGSPPDVTGCPESFKKFVRGLSSRSTHGTVNVDSKPVGVQVFVDGIYRGVTPSMFALSQGRYKITLASNGRKTVSRTINISDRPVTVAVVLPWQGVDRDVVNSRGVPTSVDGLVVADTLSSFAATQKTIVHSLYKDLSGYHSSIQVIDGTYHQPFKKIDYKKAIRDFKTSAPSLLSYYLSRIDTQVVKPAGKLYQSDYDGATYKSLRLSDRPKKQLTKNPVFWGVLGGLVLTGIVLGLTQTSGASGGGTVPATGSVSIDMGGF